MSTLRNRVAVHAINDLVANAPSSYHAMQNWLTHSGFWLAELAQCAKSEKQVTYSIELLGMALVLEHKDFTVHVACQCIRDHMRMHQVLKEEA